MSALGPTATALTAAEWRKQTIYQAVTDRFARTDLSTTARCDTSEQVYCGGTWRGLISKLDYIQGMGFTAVWISPVVKQVDGNTRDGWVLETFDEPFRLLTRCVCVEPQFLIPRLLGPGHMVSEPGLRNTRRPGGALCCASRARHVPDGGCCHKPRGVCRVSLLCRLLHLQAIFVVLLLPFALRHRLQQPDLDRGMLARQ